MVTWSSSRSPSRTGGCLSFSILEANGDPPWPLGSPQGASFTASRATILRRRVPEYELRPNGQSRTWGAWSKTTATYTRGGEWGPERSYVLEISDYRGAIAMEVKPE